jgi:hypothetical protein
MSVMMFIIIANSLAAKIALALLALIFEMTKLTDLHKVQSVKKWKFIYGTSYFLKALLSVIASVGLVLTLFAAQESVSTIKADRNNADFKAYDTEVDYWNKEIELLDETVDLLNENLARNPEGYGISGKTFVTQIQAVQETKKQYREKYQEAVDDRLTALAEASVNVNPADMFTEIGSVMRINPETLKMWVFVLIMILVEVSLALTSNTGANQSVKSPVTESVISDNPSKKSITNPSPTISGKGLNLSLMISRHQAIREKTDSKLMTQAELAKELKVSMANISNVYRRYIKPLMKKNGIMSYTDLYSFLKVYITG